MTLKRRHVRVSPEHQRALGEVTVWLHTWTCDGCEDAALWNIFLSEAPAPAPGWLLLPDGVHCLCPLCAEGVN